MNPFWSEKYKLFINIIPLYFHKKYSSMNIKSCWRLFLKTIFYMSYIVTLSTLWGNLNVYIRRDTVSVKVSFCMAARSYNVNLPLILLNSHYSFCQSIQLEVCFSLIFVQFKCLVSIIYKIEKKKVYCQKYGTKHSRANGWGYCVKAVFRL